MQPVNAVVGSHESELVWCAVLEWSFNRIVEYNCGATELLAAPSLPWFVAVGCCCEVLRVCWLDIEPESPSAGAHLEFLELDHQREPDGDAFDWRFKHVVCEQTHRTVRRCDSDSTLVRWRIIRGWEIAHTHELSPV